MAAAAEGKASSRRRRERKVRREQRPRRERKKAFARKVEIPGGPRTITVALAIIKEGGEARRHPCIYLTAASARAFPSRDDVRI